MLSLLSHKHQEEVALTITARTFIKVLLLILATFLLLTVVRQAASAVVLILIALLVAIALNAPVGWTASHLPGKLRNNRSLATALAFLLVVALLVGLLALALPPLLHQTTQLIDNAPSLVHEAQRHNSEVNRFVTRYHLQGQVNDVTNELTTNLRESAGTAITAVTGILSSLVSVLIILVLTFMMLLEGPHWLEISRSLVRPEQRSHLEHLRSEMYNAIRGFVNGQVLLAAIAALLLVPALIIFSVPYPAALAAVVFICCLVPMVGNIVAAFFIVGVALFQSPVAALGVLLYYVAYQQIENFILQPRIQASATNLSPLLVLVSLIVGLSVGGLFGGLVAIPVVACLRVWVVDYLETRGMLNSKPAPTPVAKN